MDIEEVAAETPEKIDESPHPPRDRSPATTPGNRSRRPWAWTSPGAVREGPPPLMALYQIWLKETPRWSKSTRWW